MEKKTNAVTILLAFAVGVMVGRNWPKLKKSLQPLMAGLEKQYGNLSFASLGALAKQKERFEDMMARHRSAAPKRSRRTRR